jgi:hypothetical protein
VKLEGFIMEGDPDNAGMDHPAFSHKYSGGLFSFSQGQDRYDFEFGEGKLEEHLFRIPAGTYLLDAKIREASLYGQAGGSFLVKTGTVFITELTDTLAIEVEANCSLVLVSDELEQLDEGPFIIERHSYTSEFFKSYPMNRDPATGLYYSYFTPDPVQADPSAFLWFYSRDPGPEAGGLSTTRFEQGYQYFFKILE